MPEDSADQGASAGAPEVKESIDAERLLSSLVGNSTKSWGADGGSLGARLFVKDTSSVTAFLYHTTRGAASSSMGRRWSRCKSRRGTHLGDPILTSCPEELLLGIFLGTKPPALALSDVGWVRDAEGMGEDEVANMTNSWPPTDVDAMVLVIGHSKRADGSQKGENLPF